MQAEAHAHIFALPQDINMYGMLMEKQEDGKTWSVAATHTNQHGTASRLGQDPSNAADVLYGIWEQYCKHKYIYMSAAYYREHGRCAAWLRGTALQAPVLYSSCWQVTIMCKQ